MAELSGRVVLVTGGARGIGAEVALQASRAGATVAVGYRTSTRAAQAVVERIRLSGGVAESFAGDVADADAVHALVGSVERRLGPVDALVNAAATMLTGDFLETAEAEWERIIREDLYSVVFTCRAVLPGMIGRGSGAIVNIVSRLAFVGAADAAPYAAAKAAVVSLTRSLATAYGPNGVRVNAVAPGTTNTDMGRAVIESAQGRDRAGRIPIRRFVEPAEVAAAAVFLLSDRSTGLAGQTLHVNGGELMV
ncbi:MAG TPA: SDR family oxidoreductase [Gaiellaceae bacterium]|nr:SDR family oxidoreductase [Gaiellaceae bacterium]